MSQVTASNIETPTERGATRPIGLWVVIVLSALMVFRTFALRGIPNLGETGPEFWIVAFTGDVFVGITALIVAGLLWRVRGLAVWTIGIVWQVIGLNDFTVAWQLFLIEPPFFDTGNMGNVPFVIFAVGIVVHLLCIYLLVRYRRYYLG